MTNGLDVYRVIVVRALLESTKGPFIFYEIGGGGLVGLRGGS